MRTLSDYSRILLGYHNEEPIYLLPPEWNCGWYWGFGYLGNKNCHYHVDGLKKQEKYNVEKSCFEYEFFNLSDGFINHFGKTFIVRPSHLWRLADLFESFYMLRKMAEFYKHGSLSGSDKSLKKLIVNEEEITKINNVILPQLFEEIYKILKLNLENPKLHKKILSLILKGNTMKVVDFMNENKFNTDDLKSIEGVTKHDFNVVHAAYWKNYHSKK